MNRIITIIVIIIILLGLGWWVFYTPKTVTMPVGTNTPTAIGDTNSPSTSTNTTTGGIATKPKTFQSIITQKGSYKCTYNKVTQAGQTISTIYISEGKLRGEFRDIDAVGNMMIYNGGTLYIWQEGKTVGTKLQISTIAQLPAVIPKDLTSASSLGSGINSVGWDCHQSTNPASLFVPSTAIKFTAN